MVSATINSSLSTKRFNEVEKINYIMKIIIMSVTLINFGKYFEDKYAGMKIVKQNENYIVIE